MLSILYIFIYMYNIKSCAYRFYWFWNSNSSYSRGEYKNHNRLMKRFFFHKNPCLTWQNVLKKKIKPNISYFVVPMSGFFWNITILYYIIMQLHTKLNGVHFLLVLKLLYFFIHVEYNSNRLLYEMFFYHKNPDSCVLALFIYWYI